MTQKKNLLSLFLLGSLSLESANAALIVGDVRFAGTAALDNLPNSATTISFTTPSDTLVTGASGDLLGTIGQTATFSDFTFGVPGTIGDTFVASLPTIPGGWNFDLIRITSNQNIGDHRELKGLGNLSGPPGFDDTLANFELFTEPLEPGVPLGENIRFSASIVTIVPEPSSMLLASLAAVPCLLRRRRK